MDFRRIAREAQAAAREVRSTRAAIAIHHACEALLLAEAYVETTLGDDQLWLVSGRSNEDRSEDEVEWIAYIKRHQADAMRMVEELTKVAADAAVNLGREDLFGLSQTERVSLKDMIGSNDPRATIGRHGLTWSVQRRQLD